MQNYAEIIDHLRRDLADHVSDNRPFPNGEVRDAACDSLSNSFFKKLCPVGDTTDADENALIKFISINNSIGREPYKFKETELYDGIFYDYFKSIFRDATGYSTAEDMVFNKLTGTYEPERMKNFDLEFIREYMNVGPGAAQKADSSTMTTKLFTGPISHYNNDYLIALYRAALVETGLWAEAEMLRFNKFGFVSVDGGKLFFALKNAEISRTCCTEASLEMLFQKALGSFYEYRLEKFFGISLSSQPDRNRELARRGSLYGTYGTIDLVSASDSIPFVLFQDIQEDGFTKAIVELSRSKVAVLPDGSQIRLNMISTMGNGFTFPLQTLIFASAVKAVYQMMGIPHSAQKLDYGVFGDDIVVRREAYYFLVRMLNKLGFSVNEGKSFNTGPFRESCGEDYYDGINIRGVYIRSLETPQQVCSAINRLNRWSARHNIILPSLMKKLKSMLPVRVPLVPYSESDEAGYKVPFVLTKPIVTDNYWFKYRYYRRKKARLLVPEPDASPNPPGFGLAFLSGHTRRPDYPISNIDIDLSRSDAVYVSLRDRPNVAGRYKVSHRTIPWWDWPGESGGRDTTSYEAWKSFMTAT